MRSTAPTRVVIDSPHRLHDSSKMGVLVSPQEDPRARRGPPAGRMNHSAHCRADRSTRSLSPRPPGSARRLSRPNTPLRLDIRRSGTGPEWNWRSRFRRPRVCRPGVIHRAILPQRHTVSTPRRLQPADALAKPSQRHRLRQLHIHADGGWRVETTPEAVPSMSPTTARGSTPARSRSDPSENIERKWTRAPCCGISSIVSRSMTRNMCLTLLALTRLDGLVRALGACRERRSACGAGRPCDARARGQGVGMDPPLNGGEWAPVDTPEGPA
jgi:hypothetical protein